MKNKFTKKIITNVIVAGLFASVIMLGSCGKLDVVATDSVRAFGDLIDVLPPDTSVEGWDITAPHENTRLFWSNNYAASSQYDILIEFDAAPFIAAGLDSEKANAFIYGDKIIVGKKTNIETNDAKTLFDAYKQLVKLNRGLIGYHAALDHYGINLGNGNLFEWAKDMTSNDKDMVFVLNPDPFIAAGADPNNIAGWIFGKVTVDDENGKPIVVDKLLKPFNLK